MNKQEFEKIAKTQVTDSEYRSIESIYMNAGEMDKYDFCKAYRAVKGDARDLMEALSNNVDGKRIHINRLDIKIQNLEHDLENEREIKELRARELEEAHKYSKQLEVERNQIIAEKVDLALALLKTGLDEQAIAILGHAYVISLKCSCDIELNTADKLFIAETFRTK